MQSVYECIIEEGAKSQKCPLMCVLCIITDPNDLVAPSKAVTASEIGMCV